MSQQAVDAAAAKAEAAWAEHYEAIGPVIEAVRLVLFHNAAATGIGMGPQLDAAASLAVDAVVDWAAVLVGAKQAKEDALRYQHERDHIVETLPPPAPVVTPRYEDENPDAIREWLKAATATDVTGFFKEIPDDDTRTAWADQLMTWVRADGASAKVIEVVRSAQAKPADAE